MIKYSKPLYILKGNFFQTSMADISQSDNPNSVKFYMKYWYAFNNYHNKFQPQIRYGSWDIVKTLAEASNPIFYTPVCNFLHISQSNCSNATKLVYIASWHKNAHCPTSLSQKFVQKLKLWLQPLLWIKPLTYCLWFGYAVFNSL